MQDGQTAVLIAAKNGHTEMMKLLLEAKADVNVADKVIDCRCATDCILLYCDLAIIISV